MTAFELKFIIHVFLFLPDLTSIWVQNIENYWPLYGCVSILCGYLKLGVCDMDG